MKGGFTHGTVPNEVVNLCLERGVSAMAAWREDFGLTQAEVAGRIGVTQAAYAQMERVKQPRKSTPPAYSGVGNERRTIRHSGTNGSSTP